MGSLHEYEWLDGRYRLIEKIGQGSFGEVWRVCDQNSNAVMAAKVYFALDNKSNTDLEKEYKSTINLNHVNLLRPTFFGVSGERSYIIMPYCPTTASNLIGCCNEMMAWNFVRDVANGLAYLHEHDMVHHDIKPDNILIGEDGRFKITDFGVSTQLRGLMNDGSEAIKGGTEGYMGPELFKSGAESMKATDIWALGASIYEMLTQVLPFDGIGGRALLGDYMPQIEFPYNFVSDNLMQLIRDCMAKDTWDRPRAQEIVDYTKILFDESVDHPEWKDFFANARNNNESGNEPKQELVPQSEPQSESNNKRKLWWISVAAAAIIGIIVVLWIAKPRPSNDGMMGIQDPIIPLDTLPSDTLDSPILNQATYLTVNNTEKPKVYATSKKTEKNIPVKTDGEAFTIELPNDCDWLSLGEKTDTSFVLLISPNETIGKRSNRIKVIAGELIKEVPIYQEPDKDKVARSNLTPANNSLSPAEKSTLTPTQ